MQAETFKRAGLPMLSYGTGFVLRTSAISPEGWLTVSLSDFILIFAIVVGGYWFFMGIQSLIMFRKEGMRARKNIATLLLFPFWILLSSILACYALFVKDIEWK